MFKEKFFVYKNSGEPENQNIGDQNEGSGLPTGRFAHVLAMMVVAGTVDRDPYEWLAAEKNRELPENKKNSDGSAAVVLAMMAVLGGAALTQVGCKEKPDPRQNISSGYSYVPSTPEIPSLSQEEVDFLNNWKADFSMILPKKEADFIERRDRFKYYDFGVIEMAGKKLLRFGVNGVDYVPIEGTDLDLEGREGDIVRFVKSVQLQIGDSCDGVEFLDFSGYVGNKLIKAQNVKILVDAKTGKIYVSCILFGGVKYRSVFEWAHIFNYGWEQLNHFVVNDLELITPEEYEARKTSGEAGKSDNPSIAGDSGSDATGGGSVKSPKKSAIEPPPELPIEPPGEHRAALLGLKLIPGGQTMSIPAAMGPKELDRDATIKLLREQGWTVLYYYGMYDFVIVDGLKGIAYHVNAMNPKVSKRNAGKYFLVASPVEMPVGVRIEEKPSEIPPDVKSADLPSENKVEEKPEEKPSLEKKSARKDLLPNYKMIEISGGGDPDEPDKPDEATATAELREVLTEIERESKDNLVVVEVSNLFCGVCHEIKPLMLEAAKQFQEQGINVKFFELFEDSGLSLQQSELIGRFLKKFGQDSSETARPLYLIFKGGRLISFNIGAGMFMDEAEIDLNRIISTLKSCNAGGCPEVRRKVSDDEEILRKAEKGLKEDHGPKTILPNYREIRLRKRGFFSEEEGASENQYKKYLDDIIESSNRGLVVVKFLGGMSMRGMILESARYFARRGRLIEFMDIDDFDADAAGSKFTHKGVLLNFLRRLGLNSVPAGSLLFIRNGKLLSSLPFSDLRDSAGFSLREMWSVTDKCDSGQCEK